VGRAERRDEGNERSGDGDWFVVGVACTCSWIAGMTEVVVYPHGSRTRPAAAPVTRRTARAHEELIEAELVAAERMALRNPAGVEGRPGWIEAITATLQWAWRGSGVPPLVVGEADVG
jgi:hypothetical protein